MNRNKIVLTFGLMLAAALTTAPAFALNARSFVSAQGNDGAACTLAAPCRTLQRAHDQTNAGGEIDILDPAGYGSLVINKAISIVNDGVGTAGVIVPSSAVGITVSGGPSDAISLRGLSIEGGGVGDTGITFSSGKSLTVENCVIRHATQFGIQVFVNASSHLTVSNSLVADNGNNGIQIIPSGSGAVTAVFNRVQVNNNGGHGIFVSGANSTGTLKVTANESVVARNANSGFDVLTSAGKAPTTLMVFRSVAAYNITGFSVNGTGATLRSANSMVTGNTNGWAAFNSGVVLSDGNNTIEGNNTNETSPPTYARK